MVDGIFTCLTVTKCNFDLKNNKICNGISSIISGSIAAKILAGRLGNSKRLA